MQAIEEIHFCDDCGFQTTDSTSLVAWVCPDCGGELETRIND